MIGRLKGTLAEKQPPHLILDVNGVGYELEVPMTTLYRLPAVGQGVTLHTHLVVREDAHLLYGFFEKRERELFRELIRLNGVGPKLALALMSGLEVDELVRCVQAQDTSTLVKIPGVGKKTAEQILLSLGDKVGELVMAGEDVPGAAIRAPRQDGGSAMQDEAKTVLVGLGWRIKEVETALARAVAAGWSDDAGALDDLVRRTLAHLMDR